MVISRITALVYDTVKPCCFNSQVNIYLDDFQLSKTVFILARFCPNSVGCLWHSHGKNPVRLYPKLQSQPIGLRKIFIDYLFFQADQSDCTKSVSIFNRFASSEERWNQNVSCQICRAWVFPLVV